MDVIAASPLTLLALANYRALTVKTDAILTHPTDSKIVHRGGAFVATDPNGANKKTLASGITGATDHIKPSRLTEK